MIERRVLSLLLDGCVLVTGEIDRTTDFERGMPSHEALVDGRWRPDPWIVDDQALVMAVRGHGLVIITGCGAYRKLSVDTTTGAPPARRSTPKARPAAAGHHRNAARRRRLKPGNLV